MSFSGYLKSLQGFLNIQMWLFYIFYIDITIKTHISISYNMPQIPLNTPHETKKILTEIALYKYEYLGSENNNINNPHFLDFQSASTNFTQDNCSKIIVTRTSMKTNIH